jgi:hypothetical protein
MTKFPERKWLSNFSPFIPSNEASNSDSNEGEGEAEGVENRGGGRDNTLVADTDEVYTSYLEQAREEANKLIRLNNKKSLRSNKKGMLVQGGEEGGDASLGAIGDQYLDLRWFVLSTDVVISPQKEIEIGIGGEGKRQEYSPVPVQGESNVSSPSPTTHNTSYPSFPFLAVPLSPSLSLFRSYSSECISLPDVISSYSLHLPFHSPPAITICYQKGSENVSPFCIVFTTTCCPCSSEYTCTD